LSRCSSVQVRSARVGVASRWAAISAGGRSFHAGFFAFDFGFDFGFDSESSEGLRCCLWTECLVHERVSFLVPVPGDP
jgi:hypothetical protein